VDYAVGQETNSGGITRITSPSFIRRGPGGGLSKYIVSQEMNSSGVVIIYSQHKKTKGLVVVNEYSIC